MCRYWQKGRDMHAHFELQFQQLETISRTILTVDFTHKLAFQLNNRCCTITAVCSQLSAALHASLSASINLRHTPMRVFTLKLSYCRTTM
jgi:hypothetical protein